MSFLKTIKYIYSVIKYLLLQLPIILGRFGVHIYSISLNKKCEYITIEYIRMNTCQIISVNFLFPKIGISFISQKIHTSSQVSIVDVICLE